MGTQLNLSIISLLQEFHCIMFCVARLDCNSNIYWVNNHNQQDASASQMLRAVYMSVLADSDFPGFSSMGMLEISIGAAT